MSPTDAKCERDRVDSGLSVEKTDTNAKENVEPLLTGGTLTVVVVAATASELDGGQAVAIPDGGWLAWMVCFASFWANGTLFGVINSAGVFYVKLKENYGDDNESSLRISLVGSLCIGFTFLMSPVASILTDRYGTRVTAFTGSLLVVAGMLLSSFADSLEMLYLSYGALVGLGASLTYTPSLVILGHYFHKRLGLVNGIVSAGSSLFTIVMPLLLEVMLNRLGLSVTFQILTALMSTLLACSLMFRPLLVTQSKDSALVAAARRRSSGSRCGSCCNRLINTSIWKNRVYMIWAFAFPVCLFGYFVPYAHLVKHVNDVLPRYNGGVLITCIGAASGVGRIIAGQIADIPGISRILLQQVSFIFLGTFTMLLASSTYYGVLIAMCIGIGVFDGCFISLLAPIAFDIVGHNGASQAIGFLLGMCSIPLTLGPPIAGWMYDHLGKDYKIAFIAAGAPPIIGALLMFFIRCVNQPNEMNVEGQPEENHLTASITNETKLSEVEGEIDGTDEIWQLRPEFQQATEKGGLRGSPTEDKFNHENLEPTASLSKTKASEKSVYVEKHSTC